MKIVIVEPCAEARVEEIGSAFLDIKQIVGGNIESTPFEELPELAVICNEDSKYLGLEDNFVNFDDIICGTAFVCRRGEEDFESLTDEDAEQVLEILNSREG